MMAFACATLDDFLEVYRVNVVGTRNLLEALAAQQHKPHAVLLASSANIYGNVSAGVIDGRHKRFFPQGKFFHAR